MAPRTKIATIPKPRKTTSQKQARHAQPSTSTTKRKGSISEDNVPEYDKNVTSQYSREKRRFQITRASMNVEIDEQYITALAKGLTGESRNSWGLAEVRPLIAQKHTKQRNFRPLMDQTELEETWASMMADARSTQTAPLVVVPNSPNRSPILRIPIEVREIIYGYLLSYEKPIFIKHNLAGIERNRLQNHSIIRVCKQIAEEAASYLYRNNTFHAILRTQPFLVRRYVEPGNIDRRFLHYFRKLVIDCSKECWGLQWYTKVTKSVEKLVKAGAYLTSLTLIVVPRRVGVPTTALGMERNPVTFADFLWYPGTLMTAILKLSPKLLRVIIKKNGNKRLEMSVNMTNFHMGPLDTFSSENPETFKTRQAKKDDVQKQLVGLKERFDEIFKDDELAVKEGKCKLISECKVVEGRTTPM